jgi:hypothetical protein
MSPDDLWCAQVYYREGMWDPRNGHKSKDLHCAPRPEKLHIFQKIWTLKSKIVGPFADVSVIRPGDWLYFINHSYSERDHSGIFVEWTNFEKKRAVMMSYVGGKKKTPATYKIYDLSNVYYIIRPK